MTIVQGMIFCGIRDYFNGFPMGIDPENKRVESCTAYSREIIPYAASLEVFSLIWFTITNAQD